MEIVKKIDSMTDEELVKGCIECNDVARGQLYSKFSKSIMGVCLRYAGNKQEAEDYFQDGFIKIFKKINLYNFKGPLGAWMRRTVINNILDDLRREKREARNTDLYAKDNKNDDESYNDFELEGVEQLNEKRLLEMVQTLPTGYRTVFNMYAIEEMPHKEIAERLGITESTSKTQYKKAKEQLRKLVEVELKKVM
jgi:RNA polymerase sigma factor (sigma-70 family)